VVTGGHCIVYSTQITRAPLVAYANNTSRWTAGGRKLETRLSDWLSVDDLIIRSSTDRLLVDVSSIYFFSHNVYTVSQTLTTFYTYHSTCTFHRRKCVVLWYLSACLSHTSHTFRSLYIGTWSKMRSSLGAALSVAPVRLSVRPSVPCLLLSWNS